MPKLEPPSFISETKSFEAYKRDVNRWSQLTEVKVELQALLIVHYLDGHSSCAKEKIDNGVPEEKLSCKDDVKNLLAFLENIYKKDTISDAFDKFKEFTSIRRKPETTVQSFIAEWSMSHSKAKAMGCEMSDKVLAFLLLDAANLTPIERNLVLTGVDYTIGEEKKDLLDQMQIALKKFVGRSVVSDGEQKLDSTLLTSDNLEKVLIAKGWTKPKKGGNVGRERIRSNSNPETSMGASKGYKGKKNPLGKDFKVLKCFKCQCDHDSKCECPCVYHLANKCPGKPDMSLFMQRNTPAFFNSCKNDETDSEEDLVLITDSLQNLCLAGKEEQQALIDCACPTTVTGMDWVK